MGMLLRRHRAAQEGENKPLPAKQEQPVVETEVEEKPKAKRGRKPKEA